MTCLKSLNYPSFELFISVLHIESQTKTHVVFQAKTQAKKVFRIATESLTEDDVFGDVLITSPRAFRSAGIRTGHGLNGGRHMNKRFDSARRAFKYEIAKNHSTIDLFKFHLFS